MFIAQVSVLIVDDMKMVRMKLRQICNQMGITTIHEAGNGEEALESLNANHIDLVLSDWNMPKMTGIELIEKIRINPNFSKVPVIFITSEDQKETILKSLTAGVNDFIVKPFTDATVMQKIFKCLKIDNDKGTAAH
jgi:two-component system chemotaxis response regulator CheY